VIWSEDIYPMLTYKGVAFVFADFLIDKKLEPLPSFGHLFVASSNKNNPQKP